MSKYSTQLLPFAPIAGKKVQADFDGGELTSDAGVLVLRETEARVGVIAAISAAVHDLRDARYVEHEILDIVAQRVNQIACGYEDANDCNKLRNDPAHKLAAGKLPVSDSPLASQPTASRLENAARRSDLYRMGSALVDIFIASYSAPPEIIVLDFDDTEDKTHGHQQLSLFNSYYGSNCYLPLHVYEGLSGKLITSILRPGSRPKGSQIVAILKRLIARIRACWPETIIVFRGDSHFCTPEVLRYCHAHDIKYCIGLAGNAVLKRLAEPLLSEAKAVFAQSNIPVRLHESFSYKAGTWDKPTRVAAKAEVSATGCSLRFLATNLTEPDEATIYQDIYSPRGRMENYIKDHKLHLKSDRTSCNTFEANQFRLFLASAAYVLMHAFRENVLKGTEFARAQFDTIRLHLLKVGAKVRELKTRIKLHLPSSFPHKTILVKACAIFHALDTS